MELMKDSDCEIKYYPGKANVVADALSRKVQISSSKLMSMVVQAKSGLLDCIKEAQDKALLKENVDKIGIGKKKKRLVMEMNNRGFQTFKDLKPIYWWPNIKGEVAHFVERCLTCARAKADHKKPYGLLQQLEIPEWK
uniref:uncharacterized protein LOC122601197 n=1 Tax=Erigeron canadensis TaxID=72917 RepID=UPI001CB99303|nr:uncharacterized protein LOC122601197 [Erigeron canadensis]